MKFGLAWSAIRIGMRIRIFRLQAWFTISGKGRGSHGMIPIPPNLFMWRDLRRCNSPSRCWVVFGQMCKTTCCENSIPQRVRGIFFCFFLLAFVMLCENKRHFFLQEWKDKHAKCRRGEWCYPDKNLPQTDPYQAIWEVLSRLGILKKRIVFFFFFGPFPAGSVDDMRFSHPSWPSWFEVFSNNAVLQSPALNFIKSKHLLLPCNGALLWIILLSTPKFQHAQSKIQSPTFKLLVCIVDVGISEFGFWRFTERIWDAT